MIVSPGKILAAAAVCGVAVLFSLALSGCGGGFGGVGGGSPILDSGPSPEKIAVAAGDDISAEDGRKVAETVSRLNLGLGGDAVSPEDVRVSHDRAVLDRDPFSASSGVPAARKLGLAAARALRGRGYKAFEFPVPAESPIMTVAVWISETPPGPPDEAPDPKTPEGKTDAPAKTIYVRLQVFVSPAKLGLAGSDAMVRDLETQEVAVQVKTPKPKPKPKTPTVVASVAATVSSPTCAAGEVLDSRGNACVSVSPPRVAVNFSAWGLGTLSAQSGGGFLSSGDEVPQGSRVTFTAVPAAGHYVSGWGGACAGSDLADRLDGSAECWLAADSDLAVEAEFSAVPSLAGPLCPAGTLPANGLTQAEVDEQLHTAATGRDLAETCEWLRRGANVNANHGESPLHAAIASFYPAKMAKILLVNGADVNARDHIGESPLHWAMLNRTQGRFRVHDAVSVLIAHGADVNLSSNDGETPLHLAAAFLKSHRVKLMLDNGAEINRRDGKGYSPLDHAVDPEVGSASHHRKPSVARVLREHGGRCFVQIDPLCGDVLVAVNFSASGSGALSAQNGDDSLSSGDEVPQGATVVFTAVPAAGHYVSGWGGACAGSDLADRLDGSAECWLAADADLAVEAEFSAAPSLAGPLCPAGTLGKNGMTQAALNLTLRAAARGGDSAGVCEALRRGAEVNDDQGGTEFTPLQEAVYAGHLRAAELLLANGAEVNARKEGLGPSPLDLAAKGEKEKIARVLRDAGGRCFLETGPLCGVAVAGPGPVTILATVGVENSCPAGSLPADGLTQDELDRQLFDELQIGRQYPFGEAESPRTNPDKVCALLRQGANVRKRYKGWGDDWGGEVNWRAEETPLHVETETNPHVEVVRMLLDRGADVNAMGEVGYTPLHHAADSNAAVVRLMLERGANPNTPIGGKGAHTPLVQAKISRDPAIIALVEAAANVPAVAARSVPVSEDDLADSLRGRFGDAFNAGPAFGDSFGVVSDSSGGLLSRLDGVMRGGVSAKEDWAAFSGWQQENTTGRLWFSTRHRGDFGFGAGGGGMGGAVDGSPFAALSGNGLLAGGEMALGSGGSERLRFAAFGDLQSRSLLSGEERRWTDWAASGTAIETAMAEAERLSGVSDNRTRGALTEIHLGDSVGGSGLAFQAGALSESESLLSGTSRGEDLRGLRSRTAFAGVSGSADLFGGGGWRLRGAAHVGRSWAESSGVLRSGDLWASSFSAGLERGGWLYSGDGVMFRISQPLRVESWEMDLMEGGEVRRLLVSPSGRQLDLDAAYRLPLSGGGWLLLSAGVRRGSGHVGSSGLEGGALFSLERDF